MGKREKIWSGLLAVGLVALAPLCLHLLWKPETEPPETETVETAPAPQPVREESPLDLLRMALAEKYWVDTNGAHGQVLLTVERGEEGAVRPDYLSTCPVTLSVWASEQAAMPFQTLEFEGVYGAEPQVLDANFDGYNDLMFLSNAERSGSAYKGAEYYHLWVWNEEEGQFVSIPEFTLLPNPQLDPETQQIKGIRVRLDGCGTLAICSWNQWSQPPSLAFERRMEAGYDSDTDSYYVTVYDWNKLILFHETYPDNDGGFTDSWNKWKDLSYRGEVDGHVIDDTHDAFLIDTSGEKGTLLVTVEWREGESEIDLSARLVFSVWDPADMGAPIQTMEADSDALHQKVLWDINFDGYQDFAYLRGQTARGNARYNAWTWDEAAGRFVEVPEFRHLSNPELDPEHQWIIDTFLQIPYPSVGISRWEDGVLCPVRRMGWSLLETGMCEFSVEDSIDGQWQTVFRAEVQSAEGSNIPFGSWMDPDYHGDT